MAKRIDQLLRVIGIIVGVTILTACARRPMLATSPAGSGPSKQEASQAVVAPLVSRVERADLMVGVSALEIAQPVLAESAVRAGLTTDHVQNLVLQAAQEIMTLKLSLGKASQQVGAKDARRTVSALSRQPGSAILRTDITRFYDREGSTLGGEPALVSFRMQVVSAISQDPIWSAQYVYQQEPLTDNLLKLSERLAPSGTGTGWRTGSELLQRGISTALEDFNKSRENQFMAAGR